MIANSETLQGLIIQDEALQYLANPDSFQLPEIIDLSNENLIYLRTGLGVKMAEAACFENLSRLHDLYEEQHLYVIEVLAYGGIR